MEGDNLMGKPTVEDLKPGINAKAEIKFNSIVAVLADPGSWEPTGGVLNPPAGFPDPVEYPHTQAITATGIGADSMVNFNIRAAYLGYAEDAEMLNIAVIDDDLIYVFVKTLPTNDIYAEVKAVG